jgi:hypothetical protein
VRGRKGSGRLIPRPWNAQAKVKIRERRKGNGRQEVAWRARECDGRGRLGMVVKVVMVKVMCGEVRKSRLTVAARLVRDSGRA